MNLHDAQPPKNPGRYEDLWVNGMDCIEAAPVKDLGDQFGDGGTQCERIDGTDEIPDFWSLYGHLPWGGVECIGDYDTREQCVEDGKAWAAEKGVPFEDYT